MAIQVSGTQVISNARALTNIASVDATTVASLSAAGIGGVQGTTISGASQSLNVGSYQLFRNTDMNVNTTLSFASVPTNASWKYSARVGATSTNDVTSLSDAGALVTRGTMGGFAQTGGQGAGFIWSNNGYKFTCWNATQALTYSITVPYDNTQYIGGSALGGYFSAGGNITGGDFNATGSQFTYTEYNGDTCYAVNCSPNYAPTTGSVITSFYTGYGYPTGFNWSDNGSYFYIADPNNYRVAGYYCSTPYNIATRASPVYSPNVTNIYKGQVSASGTYLYVLEPSGGLNRYTLSTPYVVSTAGSKVSSAAMSTWPDFTTGRLTNASQGMFQVLDPYTVHFGSNQGTSGSNMCTNVYSLAKIPTLTIPASVKNGQTNQIMVRGSDRTIEFMTVDGGSNVYITNDFQS